VFAWADAGRPQSRVEAGSVRRLPCPVADRQPTPSAGSMSDPGRTSAGPISDPGRVG
jgi:hypothetical protein